MFKKFDCVDWNSVRDCRKSTWEQRRLKYSHVAGWKELYRRVTGTIHSMFCSEIPMISPRTIIKWILPYPNCVLLKWPSMICLMVSGYCLFSVYILLMLAMWLPWYYTYNASDYLQQTFYTWNDVSEFLPDGSVDVQSYSDLELDNVHFLITMCFIWLSTGCVIFWYFSFCWCTTCVNRTFNLWSCPGIFYTGIFAIGCVSCTFLCMSWIGMLFMPLAWRDDKDASGDDCLGYCDDFAGSNSTLVWGPYIGWAMALVGSIAACLAVFLYKLAYMWDARGRSWIHTYHSSDDETYSDLELLVEAEGGKFETTPDYQPAPKADFVAASS